VPGWARGGTLARVARSYRPTASRRAVNWAVRPLAKRGLAGRHVYVLAVRGRKTGRRYETPVTLIEDGDRWLVAPYGEVSWVRNARAAGEVELTRAGRSETLRIEEAAAEEAAPVLMRYVKAVAVVRPFFDVKPDSSIEEFTREASRHPVFRLTPRASQ
jgi:deazaflavin-dependent oxidoreductase (nitroreductase family)